MLNLLPIYISEIGNNSINQGKVSISPVKDTFEGATSQPIKYRLHLPKGLYEFMIKADKSLYSKEIEFNKIFSSETDHDRIIDFDVCVEVPYGSKQIFNPEFDLFVSGGGSQNVKLPINVFPLQEKQMDSWVFDVWNDVNSADINKRNQSLSINGIEKSHVDGAVLQYEAPIKDNVFYNFPIDSSKVNFQKDKFAQFGIRIFKDGDNHISFSIGKTSKTTQYEAHQQLNHIDITDDINPHKVKGIGFVKRSDAYHFWYLLEEKTAWESFGKVKLSQILDGKFGIFLARTSSELIIPSLASYKA